MDHWWIILIVAATAFVAWIISTLAGGGGGLLMMPVLAFLVSSRAVPPTLALGTLIASPARVFLFWRDIDWRIVRWYLPGAVIGALLGAWVFAHLHAQWLKIAMGLFLISTAFQYRLGAKKRSFPMPVWGFLPLGLIVATISGIIGKAGPVLNPFYLNYGVEKEAMIGTKSVNSTAMQIVKVSSYAAFGAMTWRYVILAIVLGLSAAIASWVGKKLLGRMPSKRFRQLVVVVMVVTGALMLWEERGTIWDWMGHGD